MPSPIGHALAGFAVGLMAESTIDRPSVRGALTPLALWCALVAALPDADLLIPHLRHRAATHSVTATALVFIITTVVTGKVTRRVAWSLAAFLASAHATHLLLDWLGHDPSLPSGLQMLWPFSDTFFYSGWELFPATERRLTHPDLIATNARAALTEVLVLGPVAAAALLVRRTRRSRVQTSVQDDRPQPYGGAAGTGGTSDRPTPRAGR